MLQHRYVEIAAARLTKWVTGFVERHGQCEVTVQHTGFTLVAENSSRAEFILPWAEYDLRGNKYDKNYQPDPSFVFKMHNWAGGRKIGERVELSSVSQDVVKQNAIELSAIKLGAVDGFFGTGGQGQGGASGNQKGAAKKNTKLHAVADIAGRADLKVVAGPGFNAENPDDHDVASITAAAVGHLNLPRNVLLVLLRRHGYGLGIVQMGDLVAHKVGHKYVQSRTAAGGWSQQRFARRRAGQVAGLVGATQDVLFEFLDRYADELNITNLALGGDKQLIEQVKQSWPMANRLFERPTFWLNEVPDPKLVVLQESAARLSKAAIKIDQIVEKKAAAKKPSAQKLAAQKTVAEKPGAKKAAAKSVSDDSIK